MYEPEMEEPMDVEPERIATNQGILLTCTAASASGIFGLFLCFADQRSHAVRHYAVQSTGLLIFTVACLMIAWVGSALFGLLPVVGYAFFLLFWMAFFACFVLQTLLRLRMMLKAYRGERFTLPFVGEKLERFE